MSRSEMAVLLPSLPTALQVMIAEIEDGKVESKRTCTCSTCVPIGLAGRFSWRLAGGTFFLFGAALVLKICFTRALVAPFLRRPARVSALVLEFADQSFSDPTRRWHPKAGMQWRQYKLSWSVRRTLRGYGLWAGLRPLQSTDMEAAPLWRRREGALREALGTHGLSLCRGEACLDIFDETITKQYKESVGKAGTFSLALSAVA